ncbi:uncharacterized protein LOC143276031 [Babylonia areolata]|uniref:uncharacterized protein LOC143276031 n=1 Tax=Babylonia areolata TaxID=304850 RepID=UPI003FD0804B
MFDSHLIPMHTDHHLAFEDPFWGKPEGFLERRGHVSSPAKGDVSSLLQQTPGPGVPRAPLGNHIGSREKCPGVKGRVSLQDTLFRGCTSLTRPQPGLSRSSLPGLGRYHVSSDSGLIPSHRTGLSLRLPRNSGTVKQAPGRALHTAHTYKRAPRLAHHQPCPSLLLTSPRRPCALLSIRVTMKLTAACLVLSAVLAVSHSYYSFHGAPYSPAPFYKRGLHGGIHLGGAFGFHGGFGHGFSSSLTHGFFGGIRHGILGGGGFLGGGGVVGGGAVLGGGGVFGRGGFLGGGGAFGRGGFFGGGGVLGGGGVVGGGAVLGGGGAFGRGGVLGGGGVVGGGAVLGGGGTAGRSGFSGGLGRGFSGGLGGRGFSGGLGGRGFSGGLGGRGFSYYPYHYYGRRCYYDDDDDDDDYCDD